MQMSAIVLQGLPGSGKSRWVRNHCPEAAVVSADLYFEEKARRLGKSYKDVFDFAERQAAHHDCLRRFVALLGSEVETVVVDNTNLTAVEMSPYAQLALAFGRELRVVRIESGLSDEALAARNAHGVSLQALRAMRARLQRFEPAPWWPAVEEVRS